MLAKKYFAELLTSERGKAKLYKDILAHGYQDFFTHGFALKQINTHFEALSKVEKAEILGSVIEALEVDLKRFSSRDKKKKFDEFHRAQVERM